MERHYYEELMTLACGIYHWAETACKQHGNAVEIDRCLWEMRSRCIQLNNLAVICRESIIEDIQKKGE
jgi:hypothetical protein